MKLTSAEAEQRAFDFLMEEWNIASEERECFAILTARLLSQGWYIVEISAKGLPDRWVIQVYDTGECDPNYTFTSLISNSGASADLEGLPESIAKVLAFERNASG